MAYLSFATPVWILFSIAAALVLVVLYTRVYGALGFFLASAYSTLIVRVGPTTLVPLTFCALLVAVVLHLRQVRAFRLHPTGRPILGTYLALIAWILLRGWIGVQDSAPDVKALLYLVVVVNLIPFLLATALIWDDLAVQDFIKGFVAAVVLQMVVVWTRAMDAGLGWSAWLTDFWLTRWSGTEASPFVTLTGVTNYHWYSWNLGLAAMAVLFVLRSRNSRYRRFYFAAGALFLIACMQQVALVGSRQSIISLIVAVLVTAWTKIRKALLNVGAFVVVSLLALAALRALVDLEPLPVALMHGADSVAEAFDPALSRGLEWQKGLEAFMGSPLIGVGFSSDEGFSLGHNFVINTLANLGLVGFAGFSLLLFFYLNGPLRAVLREKGAALDINRGLLGMQVFLIGTSLASGSLIASSGLLWIGAIVVRRAGPLSKRKAVPARYQTRAVPA